MIFTHDLDFSALLAATGENGPSVIQARTQDVTPDAIGRDVIRVLRLRSAEVERGAIVSVDTITSRVKILPIRRDPGKPRTVVPEVNRQYSRSVVEAAFPGLHPRKAFNARSDRIILMLLEDNEDGFVNGFDREKRELWMQFKASARSDNALLKSGVPTHAFFKARTSERYQYLGEISLVRWDDSSQFFVFRLDDSVDMTTLP